MNGLDYVSRMRFTPIFGCNRSVRKVWKPNFQPFRPERLHSNGKVIRYQLIFAAKLRNYREHWLKPSGIFPTVARNSAGLRVSTLNSSNASEFYRYTQLVLCMKTLTLSVWRESWQRQRNERAFYFLFLIVLLVYGCLAVGFRAKALETGCSQRQCFQARPVAILFFSLQMRIVARKLLHRYSPDANRLRVMVRECNHSSTKCHCSRSHSRKWRQVFAQ